MIRSAIALVFLAAPALAAPTGHRQPTPATVQQPGTDPAPPSNMDTRTQATQTEHARIEARKSFMKRQGASDAKLKRTIGGICSGC